MRRARFRRLIESFGAEPSRWPAGEREAMQRYVAQSPAAREVLAQAKALDELLGRFVLDSPTEATERIVASLARLPEQRPPAWRPWLARATAPLLWPRLAALATASILGVLIGLSDVGDRIVGAQDADFSILVDDPTLTVGLEP